MSLSTILILTLILFIIILLFNKQIIGAILLAILAFILYSYSFDIDNVWFSSTPHYSSETGEAKSNFSVDDVGDADYQKKGTNYNARTGEYMKDADPLYDKVRRVAEYNERNGTTKVVFTHEELQPYGTTRIRCSPYLRCHIRIETKVSSGDEVEIIYYLKRQFDKSLKVSKRYSARRQEFIASESNHFVMKNHSSKKLIVKISYMLE